uniref:PHD finger protein 14-like n=1 Tax=Dermatophagoides pteronyssinus TaxID=6956 RepID=A0A6P6YH80_DERPT|nr:PHD finger protein 14-like [Dermatophagoides pteronyssinus]
MPKNNKISNKQQQQTPAFENAALAFVYKSLINRDPNKRKIKPVESILSMDADLDDDSESDDSDYNPPDNVENNEESSSSNETDSDDDEDEEESSSDEDNVSKSKSKTDKLLNQSSLQKSSQRDHHQNSQSISNDNEEILKNYRKILICSVCLGEQSHSDDELVECDACGITVHELCYGIQSDDTESIHSNASSASTEPWFCDPCKAGIRQPFCELCPTESGIFKLTDNGRWVHMVCALYTQGVTFVDPEKLRGPNLSQIQFNQWGSKICMLCDDENFAQTGVCIRCDAGFCKTNFHATCAQRQGLLTELRHQETEELLDPFIAYCRLHSDRQSAKKKRKNYLTLLARYRILSKQQQSNGTSSPIKRIEDSITNHRTLNKLTIQRQKFQRNFQSIGNSNNNVLTKRTPRLLDASPSAMRRLMNRCELAGYSNGRDAFLIQEEMNDIRRKWYIPPAFSIEFVSYYLDRNRRICQMQQQSHELIEENKRLNEIESKSFAKYNKLLKKHEQLKSSNEKALSWFQQQQQSSSSKITNFINENDEIRRIKLMKIGERIMSLPEMIINNTNDQQQQQYSTNGTTTTTSVTNKSNNQNDLLSTTKSSIDEFQLKKCATCKKSKEPHMMALCDSCNLYYHLHCLDPPLRRMPKKTRFGGWQCSNCTENEEQTNDDEMAIDLDNDNDEQSNNKCNGTLSNDDSNTDPLQQSSTIKTRRRLRENPKMVTKYADYDESSNPTLSSSSATNRRRQQQNKNRSKLSPPSQSASSASTPPPSSSSTLAVENSLSSSNLANIRRGRQKLTKTAATSTKSTSESLPSSILTTTIIPSVAATTITPNNTKCSSSHQQQHSNSSSSTKSLLSSSTSAAAIPSSITPTTTATVVTVSRKRKLTDGTSSSSILLNNNNNNNIVDNQSLSIIENGGENSDDLSPINKSQVKRLAHHHHHCLSKCFVCKQEIPSSMKQNVRYVCLCIQIFCFWLIHSFFIIFHLFARCDNCSNHYHFGCLQPPCTKNPKRRGYTWCCFVCEKKNEQKRSESHSTNVQTSSETSLLLNNDPNESISIDNQSEIIDNNRLGCNDTVVETIENDNNNDQTEKESKLDTNLNKKVKEKCNKNVSTINQKIQSENFKQQVTVKKEIIDINDTTVADRSSSSSSSSDEQSALTIDDNPRRNSSNETLAVNNNNNMTTTTPDDINTVLNDIIMLEEEAQNHQQQKQLEQPKIKQEITETVKNEIEDDDNFKI